MKRVDLIYFDVTSGHRSAALALEKALKLLDEPLQIRVLNFTDILQHHAPLQTLAHIGIEVFNWGVRHETAYFADRQVALFQWLQAQIPASAIRQIAKFWADDRPDVVVSVMPICNLLLERTLHAAHPDCPYVTIVTDYEECQKNYYFDTRIDGYFLNPSPKLTGQALKRGIPAERLLNVVGMPIDPLFYEPFTGDKAEALAKLGLNPAAPTVLVGFGGQGSVFVKQCADELFKVKQPINAIFLCGRHQTLYDALCALDTPYPKLVLSFLPDAPAYYYQLAQIVVGKPGSMTITEAIITHTALLAVESKSLKLVQRGNEAWLRQSGVGDVIRIPQLAAAVERTLASKTISSQLAREWHRGVFEIAQIIVDFAHGRHLTAETQPTETEITR